MSIKLAHSSANSIFPFRSAMLPQLQKRPIRFAVRSPPMDMLSNRRLCVVVAASVTSRRMDSKVVFTLWILLSKSLQQLRICLVIPLSPNKPVKLVSQSKNYTLSRKLASKRKCIYHSLLIELLPLQHSFTRLKVVLLLRILLIQTLK